MITRSDYPDAPGFKTSGPSEQAAQAVAGMAKALGDQMRNTIATTPNGLTADKIAGKRICSILSVRPRVAELHRQGEIRPSGARGKNESGMSASVWVLASSPVKGGGA